MRHNDERKTVNTRATLSVVKLPVNVVIYVDVPHFDGLALEALHPQLAESLLSVSVVVVLDDCVASSRFIQSGNNHILRISRE